VRIEATDRSNSACSSGSSARGAPTAATAVKTRKVVRPWGSVLKQNCSRWFTVGRDSPRAASSRAHTARGVAWAGNLVYAGILGYEESRRIRAQYFAWMPSTEIGPQAVRLSWGF